MAAVFLFPQAAVSLSRAESCVFSHKFRILASLASRPMLFYAYVAEQSQLMDMWCRDEDAFKPGTGMYVGGNGKLFPLHGEAVGD